MLALKQALALVKEHLYRMLSKSLPGAAGLAGFFDNRVLNKVVELCLIGSGAVQTALRDSGLSLKFAGCFVHGAVRGVAIGRIRVLVINPQVFLGRGLARPHIESGLVSHVRRGLRPALEV